MLVTYYQMGDAFYRKELDPDLPASDPYNTPKLIADQVGDINLVENTIAGAGGKPVAVTASISFAPKFSRRIWTMALPPSATSSQRMGTTVFSLMTVCNQ